MPRPVTSQPPDPFRQRGRRDWETQDDPRQGITKATVNIPDQVRRIVPEDEVERPLDGEAGQTVLDSDGKAASASSTGSGTRSLWWTREFKLYYLVYLVGVPLLCWVPIRLSRSECVPGMIDKAPSRRSSDIVCRGTVYDAAADHPNYGTYSWRLSPGWLFSRPIVRIFNILFVTSSP
jgi:hypothetical protein